MEDLLKEIESNTEWLETRTFNNVRGITIKKLEELLKNYHIIKKSQLEIQNLDGI